MAQHLSKNGIRKRVHERIRKKIQGSAARPRLNVFRSLRNIYAQVIDDEKGATLVSASSQDKELRGKSPNGGNLAGAKSVGTELAKRALAAGIQQVVFDRGGYHYHGRVKALAEAAREAGLKF